MESEVFTNNNIAGYANVARLRGAKHVLSVYCVCLSYLKDVDHNLTGSFCKAVLFCFVCLLIFSQKFNNALLYNSNDLITVEHLPNRYLVTTARDVLVSVICQF